MKAAAGYPFWHYTVADYARAIIVSGHIKVESEADHPLLRHVRCAAWFSTNQTCEPTALKSVRYANGFEHHLTQHEQARQFGLYRFGFNEIPGLIDWREYKATSGISAFAAKGMERVGKDQSANCKRWYASYSAVAITPATMIEQWNEDSGWNRIGLTEEISVPDCDIVLAAFDQ